MVGEGGGLRKREGNGEREKVDITLPQGEDNLFHITQEKNWLLN